MQDWKRQSKAQVSIVTEKRANVLAMNIVEDFIYLNTSNSPSNLEVRNIPVNIWIIVSLLNTTIWLYMSNKHISTKQIWLRGTQHKVGRLSAGSKITSMLTANDMILCGTESGLIKVIYVYLIGYPFSYLRANHNNQNTSEFFLTISCNILTISLPLARNSWYMLH